MKFRNRLCYPSLHSRTNLLESAKLLKINETTKYLHVKITKSKYKRQFLDIL